MILIEMINITPGVKIVYILLDGVSDLPHKDLGNLTPLDAAHTPNMDRLAQNGCMGESVTVKEGLAPQSDIAVFNMLGYSFEKSDYVGRGVVETIGCDIDFQNGDLAVRGNFATIDDELRIIDRRAGRNITAAEAHGICKTLTERITFSDPEISCVIEPTIAHRLVIRFRHNRLAFSEKITNTDPAYLKINGIGVVNQSLEEMHIVESQPEDGTQAALLSAKTINEFSNQVLNITKSHPVNANRKKEGKPLINAILLRDSGNKLPEVEPIKKRYNLATAAVVDMPVEIGISRILGMKVLPVTETNDYRAKASIISDNFPSTDCIYVHLKGPDEFGHDGDPLGKKKSIEDIDRSFFGPLLDKLNADVDPFVIISADHSTPCVKKAHSADPVPVLFSGSRIKKDGSKRFTEKYGAAGSLGRLMGSCVLSAALESLNQ
jgi:2,3-bisphosphoglycerate-independent phosphoglycerate mutase